MFSKIFFLASFAVGLASSTAVITDMADMADDAIYKLPEGVLASDHPGLDIAAQYQFYRLNPRAELPSIPRSIIANMTVVRGSLIKRQLPAPLRICETTEGSPHHGDLSDVGNFLKRKGKTPCCQTQESCTTLATDATAAVSICAHINHCMQCKALGERVNEIAKNCKSGYKAGGIMRYLHFFYFFTVHFLCLLTALQVGRLHGHELLQESLLDLAVVEGAGY